MINTDYLQELLIKPTPEDLNIYKRMGLDTYTSPTGARYPLAQDYFSPPKRSSINQDFVDSLLADEHPDVQENKSKLPPLADPDQPLDFFADPVPPAGIPDIADPQGLTGDIKPPVSEDAVRALKQIPKGLARGAETVLSTVGSMARWVAERATIGNILTRHTDLPYGAGVVAEYLVRKFGPKKPAEFFDKQMKKYAKQGEKWADFWEEQAQKGWEAPDPEVTQAKWRDMPITKGIATISEAAPNYLVAIASSVLTKSPQTGLLFISALSGAGAYRRQRKAGAGVTKANAIATLTGAWEYITEKVPFDEVFKPAKSKFLKMLKLGTMESAQEFVQGIGENFLEYFGYKAKDLKSVPAAVKEGLEHTMDGWVENVVAGAGLGVMGAGIVPKGGLYDSKEKERLVRGKPQREELRRPVQVEGEGETKIEAGRVLQEQVAEIPPTEAIAVPEKPTKPKAVEGLKVVETKAFESTAGKWAVQIIDKGDGTFAIGTRGEIYGRPYEAIISAETLEKAKSVAEMQIDKFQSLAPAKEVKVPAEAIAEPEKPTEAITKPEAVEAAPEAKLKKKAATEGEKRIRLAKATPESGLSIPEYTPEGAALDTSEAAAEVDNIKFEGKRQEKYDKIRDYFKVIDGVYITKVGTDSTYGVLPTGHLVRVGNHLSYGYTGQQADIHIQPIADEESQATDEYEVRAYLGADKKYTQKVSNVGEMLSALNEAVKQRQPTTVQTAGYIQTKIRNDIAKGKPVPREVLEEYKSEKWAQEALAKPPTVAKAVPTKVEPITEAEVKEFPKEALTDEQMTKAETGEIPSEGEYQSQSGVFNEHLDYFQKRQLPKTSQIPSIQAQIRTVNGKRLSGKISAQKANYLIRQLRKQLITTARNEGIALRMTRGGKVSLSVRKAGTFVPEEFAQYGKFEDVYPLGKDITRSIQEMDGSLSVKGKLREKGQAGPLERHVLWPTRDISIQKIKYIKEKMAELKSIFKTKKGSKEDEQVNLVLEQIAKEDRDKPIKDILSRKTLRAIASPKVIQQAIGLREFYDSLIEEQNLAREMRDQDPIPYRHNYSPHILRDTTIWEHLMMTGKEPKDVTKADLPDYIKPNAPFNPRAMAREAGIKYEKRVKSAQELAESYLVTAAKDIFNTSIIQNNKAFIQQLDAMGYKKASNYLADWTAEAYAGIQPTFDRAIKLSHLPKVRRKMQWFNRVRNMAVFPLNFAWNLVTQPSSMAFTIGRHGGINTLRGFKQWISNPNIRKEMSEEYYSYIVKSSQQGRITKQDAENLIGAEVKVYRTPREFIQDVGGFITHTIEKILTGTSIRAAYLTGRKKGLTGEALINYASDEGAKAQSMYNDEDKPAFLRSLAVKTAFPYQTFNYEVVNAFKEWAGRTGMPPDTQLQRMIFMARFLAAAIVFALIGKRLANKDIWSWKRPPIPFAEVWLIPIMRYFNKEYIGKSGSGLPSPIETAQRLAKGLDDFLETGATRKLRNEVLKYGPGILSVPGGVQISRTVDAIIAYAQGGVKDRKGRLLFEMEDPQDLVQAIFSGVWSTEGGRAYLDIDYKIKKMTDKELRQYRRKNTYQKTQYPKSKGIIKGRPHKGREQLVENIDKELEKRK